MCSAAHPAEIVAKVERDNMWNIGDTVRLKGHEQIMTVVDPLGAGVRGDGQQSVETAWFDANGQLQTALFAGGVLERSSAESGLE